MSSSSTAVVLPNDASSLSEEYAKAKAWAIQESRRWRGVAKVDLITAMKAEMSENAAIDQIAAAVEVSEPVVEKVPRKVPTSRPVVIGDGLACADGIAALFANERHENAVARLEADRAADAAVVPKGTPVRVLDADKVAEIQKQQLAKQARQERARARAQRRPEPKWVTEALRVERVVVPVSTEPIQGTVMRQSRFGQTVAATCCRVCEKPSGDRDLLTRPVSFWFNQGKMPTEAQLREEAIHMDCLRKEQKGQKKEEQVRHLWLLRQIDYVGQNTAKWMQQAQSRKDYEKRKALRDAKQAEAEAARALDDEARKLLAVVNAQAEEDSRATFGDAQELRRQERGRGRGKGRKDSRRERCPRDNDWR